MEPVRDTLHKIVIDMIRQSPAEEAPIVAWQFVCGKTVAEKTEALSFQNETLTIRVPDATWRKQLADMMPHYLEQLRRYTGQKIERLSFVLPEGLPIESKPHRY